MTNLIWTVEGKSRVSTWGTYGLRVKRLGKGKYWWVITGILEGRPKASREVKVVDGIGRSAGEAENLLVAALCGVSPEYREELRDGRLEKVEWHQRERDWKPKVGAEKV